MTSRAARRTWQRVDGVLLLDKAGGMTSNYALQGARRLFSAAKAGHTGTLDPLATGLLPLCFGEATKFSADLLDADKCYEADLLFGATTASGDADGALIERRPVAFDAAQLNAALEGFRGPLSQVPPMVSALKQGGRPLYELARQGIVVERQPRQVTIRELLLLEFSGERCRLRVTCSKGTYIRTLAEDLGEVLGCGAHLTALRRTRVGPLDIAQAISLKALAALAEEDRGGHLLPPDTLLQSLPAVDLDAAAVVKFAHGNPVVALAPPGKCRVYGEGRLLGVGIADGSGRLQPSRLVGA